MVFLNIDARGGKRDRVAVATIQKRHGAAERLAAAQERRNRKKAKRASATTVRFYPWPTGGARWDEPEGAYAQGPNGDGQYQVVVVGAPKGDPALYAAAMSQWVGSPLSVLKSAPMLAPAALDDGKDEERKTGYARGFLSIILEPAPKP
jgi:hypothetical protein